MFRGGYLSDIKYGVLRFWFRRLGHRPLAHLPELPAELVDLRYIERATVGVHADQWERVGVAAGEVHAVVETTQGIETTKNHGAAQSPLYDPGGDADCDEIFDIIHVPDPLRGVYLASHRRRGPEAELRLS